VRRVVFDPASGKTLNPRWVDSKSSPTAKFRLTKGACLHGHGWRQLNLMAAPRDCVPLPTRNSSENRVRRSLKFEVLATTASAIDRS
jgi:hypothetical protein